MIFKREINIQFSQCDPAGILFFAQIFEISHDLLQEALKEWGVNYDQWFNHPQLVFPIVSAQSSFQSPLRAGKTYLAEIQLSQKRDHSVEFTYQFSNKDQQNIAKVKMAEVKTVHVCIDKSSQEKSKLPDYF